MESLNWMEKLEKFKFPIGLSLVGIVLIIGGIVTSGLNKPPKSFPKESIVEKQKTVSVDVSGAVSAPGVYKLQEGSRIEDAVKAAGGTTETVNQEYVSKYLNMAQKLSDGTKIYVPSAGEEGMSAGVVAGVKESAKVNINTASQSELEALPGIGPVTASKIISERPYQTVEELINKKIISKSVFEKIKDQVVVY